MTPLRLVPSLLLLLAACTGTDPCVDADEDGTCAALDCNDSDPTLSAADADQDGQSSCDGDCDDTDPSRHTLDADDDGVSLCDDTPDCDDTNAAVHPLDADDDGVSTCDPVPDCDDTDAQRAPTLEEVCGDGIDNDCSGTEDDADRDGDGESSLACGGTDCDDANAFINTQAAEACSDGLDNDCSGLVDAEDTDACDCPDADGDDYACDDVDDTNPECGADPTDDDLDGVCADVDSNDRNANCGRISVDTDGDGYCADIDVADNNPNCFSTGIDEDGDGFCFETDSDDTNATCTTTDDSDGDGVCDEVDTAPNDSLCFTSTTDDDGDGYCVETDVDDTLPGCWSSTIDEDGDGLCIEADCDDSALRGAACSEDCQTWYGDVDGDGYLSSDTVYDGCQPGPEWQTSVAIEDCDDQRARLNPGDLDGDGVSSCDTDPDCDDTDPTAFPGATELCDGIDNDCTDGIDDGFDDADGDGLDDCDDVCPDDLPTTATAITFTYMGYACRMSSFCSGSETQSVGMPTLVVNGQSVGTLPQSALGCYGQQGVRGPVEQRFDLPDGLWDPTGSNTVEAQGIPQTNMQSSCPGVTTIQMTGWVEARIHFDNEVPDSAVCLYSGPGTSCGASYSQANTFACGRPRFFFGGSGGVPSVSCPSGASRPFFPSQVVDDQDGDGVPAECDDCNADASAFPGNSEVCDNGIDDDCDGLTDVGDDDCCLGTDTTLSEGGLCFDTVDNDCDGLADEQDPDCDGSACDVPDVLSALVARPSGSTASYTATTCDAGPAPGLCETDATTAMHWTTVPIRDPEGLGWTLEACAPDATAVIAAPAACADGECLDREFGCYTTTGTGDAEVTLGIGSGDSTCEVATILTLTAGGAP